MCEFKWRRMGNRGCHLQLHFSTIFTGWISAHFFKNIGENSVPSLVACIWRVTCSITACMHQVQTNNEWNLHANWFARRGQLPLLQTTIVHNRNNLVHRQNLVSYFRYNAPLPTQYVQRCHLTGNTNKLNQMAFANYIGTCQFHKGADCMRQAHASSQSKQIETAKLSKTSFVYWHWNERAWKFERKENGLHATETSLLSYEQLRNVKREYEGGKKWFTQGHLIFEHFWQFMQFFFTFSNIASEENLPN